MEKAAPPRPGQGHARLERGLDETLRSRIHIGRFGRMFRSLPPADFDDDALIKLADVGAMISDEESDDGKPKVTSENVLPPDDEENFGLPAGYTYFGQFVDHDITFDPLSSLVKRNDPDGLTNFRTPALDLDGLYGRGPDDQPYMYDADGRKFLLGDRILTGSLRDQGPVIPLAPDLPRFQSRAITGDKRNDENVIVSQLHGLFLRFHNYLADTCMSAAGEPLKFSEIQRLVRWHYQWLVLFDYLPRLVGKQMVEAILPHIAEKDGNIYDTAPKLHFFNHKNDPFMPVEFSGAAYRFGHSMVRPVYRLSAVDFTISIPVTDLDGRKLVFAPNPKDGLNGFHAFDAENGIDWRLFFETRDHVLLPGSVGKGRVQPAYKIDTSLVNPLAFLPEFSRPGSNLPSGGKNTNNLAFRNLKRGVTLQLPSGQSVARFMGLDPIPDERLLVGKANTGGLVPNHRHKSGVANKSIIDIDKRFAGKAPLWFYILAEGLDEWRKKVESLGPSATDDEKNAQHTVLGPVGGRIVAEVLIGLILGDNDSFLSMEPNWKPMFGDNQADNVFDRFTMGDLVQLVPGLSIP